MSDEYRVAQIERYLISNMLQQNRVAENERHRIEHMSDEYRVASLCVIDFF
jgi:uncharacterized FlgJ-related protein